MLRPWNAIVTFGAAIIVAGSTPASAARVFYTGTQIYEWCTAREKAIDKRASCLAYVMAIADAMADSNEVAGSRACIPLSVTGRQAVDIVVQFSRRNVASRNESAASLVAQALGGSFPCR